MRTSAHYFKDLELTSSEYTDYLPQYDDKGGELRQEGHSIHNAVEIKQEVTYLEGAGVVTTIIITDDKGVKHEVVIFHKD